MNTWRPAIPVDRTTPTALGSNQVGAAVLCRHLVADGSVHAFLADHRSLALGELWDLAPLGLPA
jgi:hypothetical protein